MGQDSRVLTYESLPCRDRSNLPVAASSPKGKGSSRFLFSCDDHSSARNLSSTAVMSVVVLSKCCA